MKSKTCILGVILSTSVCWGELSCTKHASFCFSDLLWAKSCSWKCGAS